MAFMMVVGQGDGLALRCTAGAANDPGLVRGDARRWAGWTGLSRTPGSRERFDISEPSAPSDALRSMPNCGGVGMAWWPKWTAEVATSAASDRALWRSGHRRGDGWLR